MTQNRQQNSETSLFLNLVLMLSASAVQQLGKIPDPLNGKTAVNIDGARAAIDMLDMLRNKTRGNLSDDENRFLSDTIASLQLEFVKAADPAAAGSGPKAEKRDSGAAQPEGQKQSPPPEPKEAKFHKTYE